jgi:hypothetical protein
MCMNTMRREDKIGIAIKVCRNQPVKYDLAFSMY